MRASPLLLRECFKFGEMRSWKLLMNWGLQRKTCFKFVSSCFSFESEDFDMEQVGRNSEKRPRTNKILAIGLPVVHERQPS